MRTSYSIRNIASGLSRDEFFDRLPLSEKTLFKDYKKYPFEIRNDRGNPCYWYVYKNDKPVWMFYYWRGRLLACYNIVIEE